MTNTHTRPDLVDCCLRQAVQRANNFSSLENNVKETAEMLSLARLPDAEKLILFQNQMRMLTLERLRDFILSAKSPLDSHMNCYPQPTLHFFSSS